jgi:hypothetical protein
VVAVSLVKGFYFNENTSLPDEVMDWAGLKSSNPVVGTDTYSTNTLIRCNDEQGLNFKEIADIIDISL